MHNSNTPWMKPIDSVLVDGFCGYPEDPESANDTHYSSKVTGGSQIGQSLGVKVVKALEEVQAKTRY